MVKDKSFGIMLKELREKKNVTLEQLGAGLCDPGKLSRIENGKAEAEKLFSFSKEYGVPIDAAEFCNEPNMMEETGFPKGYTAAHYRRDQDLFFTWLKENYPSIKKDIAIRIDKNITADETSKVIKKAGGNLLTNIEVFDVYTGENVGEDEKSIAYSLTFMDAKKTLTEEEVTVVFEKIIQLVESKCEAKLRG